MMSRRFKVHDDEIMIISYDYQAEEIVLDIVSDEIDADANMCSARATHQAILFCSNEKLFLEHEEIQSQEGLKV